MVDLINYDLSKIEKVVLNTFIAPARQSSINTAMHMDSIVRRIDAMLINLIHFESITNKDNEHQLSTVSHREFLMIVSHLLFHISQASDKMEMIKCDIHSSPVNYRVRNVFLPEMGGIVYGLLQTSRFVDFVSDIVNNVQQNYDHDLPYFMIVYHDDNHYTDGLHEFYLDKYVSKLIEYLNFDRTLLHMTVISDRSSSLELFFLKKCLNLFLQPISRDNDRKRKFCNNNGSNT